MIFSPLHNTTDYITVKHIHSAQSTNEWQPTGSLPHIISYNGRQSSSICVL